MRMKDLTPRDKQFIKNYCEASPDTRRAVERLLGVQPDECDKGTKIYKVAKIIMPVIYNGTVFIIMAYFDWNTQQGYQLPEW